MLPWPDVCQHEGECFANLVHRLERARIVRRPLLQDPGVVVPAFASLRRGVARGVNDGLARLGQPSPSLVAHARAKARRACSLRRTCAGGGARGEGGRGGWSMAHFDPKPNVRCHAQAGSLQTTTTSGVLILKYLYARVIWTPPPHTSQGTSRITLNSASLFTV